jgi:selenium-binding protein 1
MNALGAPSGEGPGGLFVLDHENFSVKGAWEADRGPQYLAYDFWWHLGHDTLITSEWGTPSMVEDGVNPDLFGKYGHQLHVWDLRSRKHRQSLELGAEQQMVLELRPSHDPNRTFGFVNTVVSLSDLSSAIWTWYLDGGQWAVKKIIEIPAEPASEDDLPPALKPFKAVPPLVTDINLSLDDKFLYVSCWGTGELRQYDVSDPFAPRLTGSVHLGGIRRQAAHPNGARLNGGPQMVELSRDGRRIYLSNSLYASWDAQFYPEGIRGWVSLLEADPRGGLSVDPNFFVPFDGERPHQVHLAGGDASSDSYCFPS